MKLILIPILLLLPLASYGQYSICLHDDYCTIGIDTVNRIINNLEEGPWVYYKKRYNSIQCFTYPPCYTVDHYTSKGKYIKGKKVGEWHYYYPSRKLKKTEMYSKTGQRIGKTIEYFEDGRIRGQEQWENGILISRTVFYENGYIHYQATFKDNHIVTFTIHYPSGEIKFQGNNVKGWTIEELYHFDKNGQRMKAHPRHLGQLLAAERLTDFL